MLSARGPRPRSDRRDGFRRIERKCGREKNRHRMGIQGLRPPVGMQLSRGKAVHEATPLFVRFHLRERLVGVRSVAPK